MELPATMLINSWAEKRPTAIYSVSKMNRVIDMSRAGAQKLEFIESGITRIKREVLEKPRN